MRAEEQSIPTCSNSQQWWLSSCSMQCLHYQSSTVGYRRAAVQRPVGASRDVSVCREHACLHTWLIVALDMPFSAEARECMDVARLVHSVFCIHSFMLRRGEQINKPSSSWKWFICVMSQHVAPGVGTGTGRLVINVAHWKGWQLWASKSYKSNFHLHNWHMVPGLMKMCFWNGSQWLSLKNKKKMKTSINIMSILLSTKLTWKSSA